MNKNGIVIGSDHAGWELKEAVKEYLASKGMSVLDVSEPVRDPADDYPRYAFRVAKMVADGKYAQAIALCGTGIGAAIAANRVRGVSAALCLTVEMGRIAKMHNNAHVLVLGGKITPPAQAFPIIEAWLGTAFEGGRHDRRVRQIDNIE